MGAGAATAVGVAVMDLTPANAEDLLHAPKYPWSHDGFLSTIDVARFGRGPMFRPGGGDD